MNTQFHYVGLFFKFHSFQSLIAGIRRDPLENDILYPHITFEYMPQEVDRSLFGKPVQVKIVGYGNDGENEGVKVELSSEDPVLQSMIEKIEVPHVTIAVSDAGEPVNTRRLEFHEIEPIELTGIYGGYVDGGRVILRSGKKQAAGERLSGKIS